MLNMFGRGFEEIGSSDKGLIIKNSGKVKIQWGKTFIDLLDANGRLNVKLQEIVQKVPTLIGLKSNGLYFCNGKLVAKVDDEIIELNGALEPEEVQGTPNLTPTRIYNVENIILKTKQVLTTYTFTLKYKNDYQRGDVIRSYVEKDSQIIPVEFEVLTSVNDTISTNALEPNTINDISNSFCYLVSREGDENRDLIIGQLDDDQKYNNKTSGIISKQNIFYSTKYDLDESGEQNSTAFPFYSESLQTLLKQNYDNSDYNNVLATIGILNEVKDDLEFRMSKIKGGSSLEGDYVPLVGDSIIEGSLTATNFILSDSLNQTSDERRKNIIQNTNLSIEDIANAPSIIYNLKGKDKIQGGTIAQYWESIAPWAVGKDSEGYLTLDYSALALVSAIECAREIVKLKNTLNTIKR